MPAPVPNLSGRRLQADYTRNRQWSAGVLSADAAANALLIARSSVAVEADALGAYAAYEENSARRTDRGLLIEPAGTQLLTNSGFAGAVIDGVAPDGWTPTSGMVVTTRALRDIGANAALREIVADCVYTNSGGSPVTVRLGLEAGNGVLIGSLRRAFVFSGFAGVVSSENAGPVLLRLVSRNSGGAAVGDQAPTAVASGETPQWFSLAPPIDATAVRVDPGLTWTVAAGTTATVRLVLRALQLETGMKASSWMRSLIGGFSREPDRYVNPRLVGGSPGTPGTLPQFWAKNTMSDYIVYDAAPGFIDLALINDNTAGGSAVSRSILISGATGGVPSQILAEPGQRWIAGVECTVVSATADSNPRFNISARDAAGAAIAIAGNSISTSFPLSGTVRSEASIASTGAGTAAIVLAIIVTAPAGSIATVRLQLREPRAQLLLPSAGVPGVRAADLVQHRQPALFAGPSTVTVDVELDTLEDNATAFALTTGSGHTLRVIAGTEIGVVISKAGSADVEALRPLLAAPGILRLVLSYAAGSVSIAHGDPTDGSASAVTVSGFDPATVSSVWFGSAAGANPARIRLQRLEVDAAAVDRANLPARSRVRWLPRTFVQPRPTLAGVPLANVAAYAPPAQAVAGASHVYSVIGNRYWRRSHSSAMTDTLPAANAVGAVEGTPAKIQIINDGPGSITISSVSPLRPPYDDPDAPLPPVASVVLPSGFRILFAADGYDPATKNWLSANEQWWYVIRPVGDPELAYRFDSIYGPPDPSNPNRAIIFPPAYCSYNSDIGPLRQLSTAITQAMNRWLYYRDPVSAAQAMRYLADSCAADYWRESIGTTAKTALNSQIRSTAYGYLGVRECGSGTPTDHATIRQWFRYRADQTIAYFTNEIGAGRISPGVWASTSTGRGNHAQQAGLTAAVCGAILDDAAYLDFAWRSFASAVQDAVDVPAFVGALPLEMRRAQKSLQYQCLAISALVPLAQILERAGYDCYGYLGGAFIKMVNWTVAAIDDPTLITAEQTRMIGLSTPWNVGIVAATQEPIGLGQDTDPTSGELLPNESRVAWVYIAWLRLSDAEAPWRVAWKERLEVYDNLYAGGLGGALSYLYRTNALALPPPA